MRGRACMLTASTMSGDPPVDVEAHVTAACAAWPSLGVTPAAYRAWLLAQDGLDRLASLAPRDVVLAWAAGHGSPEAHRLLELHYIPEIPHAVRRFGGDRAFVDDIAQRVRVKLLVPRDGGTAPILDYALGGSLAGLIRVAAVREALNARRSDRPAAPVEALEQLAGERDPELAHLKARYAREFERAFASAAGDLTGQERHVLRLNLSVKASIDDIARIYGTHRATAARWLTAARDRLADRTRHHLQANLGLPDAELTSLLRLIRTEATRLLASIAPGTDE